MHDDGRIDELLVDWDLQRQAGQEPAVERLCRDCPELSAELQRRIDALKATDWMFEAAPDPTAPAVSDVSTARDNSADALPATSLTGEEFMAALRSSRLLQEPRDVDELLRAQPPADAGAIAAELVRRQVLTPFQARSLLTEPQAPLVLGEYEILDKVGAGGMGQVFRARHRRMKRAVALKVLPSRLTQDAAALRRFQREVEAVARLEHVNIVTAHDAGEDRGTHYLIMQYVDGSDLQSLVRRRGPLPVAQAMDCLLQAARGLEYAHQEGVVHRDIKPSNLLLDRRGVLKILDMGLARFAAADAASPDELTSEGLTSEGTVMGTADYMSPEQALDTRQADARSDLYSLGCTLFYLLIGRPPYGGETVVQKILAHRDAPVPVLRELRPELPPAVDDIFRRLVAKNPAERYGSAAEVITAIEGCDVGANSQPEQKTDAAASASILLPREGAAPGLEPALQSDAWGTTLVAPLPQGMPETVTASIQEETFRDVSTRPVRQRPTRRRNLLVALVLFGALLAGIIITVETRHGRLVIELPDGADYRVLVDGETAQILDRSGGSLTVRVAPGRHQLIVQTADGLQLATDADQDGITMTWRGRQSIRAWFEEPATPANPELSESSPTAGQTSDLALYFDGLNDCVDLPFRCPADTPLTIEAWITTAGASDYQEIVQAYDGWVAGLGTALTTQLLPGAGVIENGKWQLARATVPVVVGAPTHIAGVFDGREMRFYVDGKLQATSPALQQPFHPSSHTFRIGMGHGVPRPQPFRGLIDEVRISTVARYETDFTPQERFDPDDQTLGLYHCDDPENAELRDSSSHGHHGYITGAVRVSAEEALADFGTWVLDRDQKSVAREREIVRDLLSWSATERQTTPDAELVLQAVTRDAQRVQVQSEGDLPAGEFRVESVEFRRFPAIGAERIRTLDNLSGLSSLGIAAAPLTADELDALGSLRTPRALALDDNGLTDEGALRVMNLRALDVLTLRSQPQLTDAVLARAATLPHLKSLDVIGSRGFTDAGVRALHGLPRLNFLRVRDLPLTDNAFAGMPTLASLAFLDVHGTRIGDATLQALAESRTLQTLQASQTSITDAGVAQLAAVATLRNLEVVGTAIDGSCFAALRGCGLTSLYAGDTQISDESLAHIGALPALIHLSLNRTAITDAGLRQLHALAALRTLDINDTNVTQAGVDELRAALPLCRIAWQGKQLEGLTDGALGFDGTGHVELPFGYDGTTPVTIEAWVRPAVDRHNGVVSNFWEDGTANHWRGVGITTYESKWTFGVSDGNRPHDVQPDELIRVGEWTHVAAQYDPTVSPPRVSLFVDGQRKSDKEGPPFAPSEHPFWIGADPGFQPAGEPPVIEAPMLGAIDEVRISRIVRYTDDFTPMRRFLSDEHTLGLYHCDDPDPHTLIDASPHAHHGISKGTWWLPLVPPPHQDDPERAAALAVLQAGGKVVVIVPGSPTHVHVSNPDQLPTTKFHLWFADLAHRRYVGDEMVSALAGCRHLRQLLLRGTSVTDRCFELAAQFPELRLLDVASSAVTEPNLQALAGLRRLTHLHLDGGRLDEADLAAIGEMRRLEVLGLNSTSVTGADLQHLSRLTQLRELYLDNTAVDDAGLRQLHGLPSLAQLSASKTRVTGAELSGFRTLVQLQLAGTEIDDSGVAALAENTGLTWALLHRTAITDDSLKELARLPRLAILHASETAITDAGLSDLAGKHGLRHLEFRATQVTSEGVARLSESIPWCRIEWTGGVIERRAPAAERVAAETILARGGRVHLETADLTRGDVSAAIDLPDKPFIVLGVALPDAGTLQASDLERLASLQYLEGVSLLGTARPSEETLSVLGRLTQLRTLNLDGIPVRDSDLERLRPLQQLEVLVLRNGRELTDMGFTHLAELSSLRGIDLLTDLPLISSTGFAPLHRLAQLRSLHLGGGASDNRDLLSLPQFPQLSYLYGARAPLTDADLAAFRGHRNLQYLRMSGAPVTDAGIRHLATIPTLAQLFAENTQITGIGFVDFEHSPLNSLDLAAAPVTDDGLRGIGRLESLRYLRLERTSITDAGLTHLYGLTDLTQLNLKETQVTESGAAALQAALPGCSIVR